MNNVRHAVGTALSIACLAALALAAPPPPTGGDTVMEAIVDEMDRSMTLQLEDLQAPYFVQYAVTDSSGYRISATCGAIVGSDDSRSRRLAAAVRVGYYDLDNTNFAGGRGGRGMGGRRGRPGGGRGMGGMTMLPVEDSYTAIRQATWLATDAVYKSAVETLAQKQAYMEDRNLTDRPDDFARVEPRVSIDAKVALDLDVETWEGRLRAVSAHFLQFPHVLDSQVTLTASADNRYLINSEGTRIRKGATGIVLAISAQAQADDGEQLAERITFHAATADGLPSEGALLIATGAMAARLSDRAAAPVLEDYLGPVLFDERAAPQLFQAMLARGVAGRAEPVGGGRRRFAGMASLDKYLGKRILPKSFRIYDDPTATAPGDAYFAGRYEIDDEGVNAERVDLVSNGRLQGMLMSRTPTADFGESNGHGRAAGPGREQAAVGCLFIEAADAVGEQDLKEALIEAAREQDLAYGLRITSIGGGGGARLAGGRGGGRFPGGFGGSGGSGTVGDPVAIFKVYLDGREELVRGCEFGALDVGTLKDIIAAGRTPIVHNTGSAAGSATPHQRTIDG